MRTQLRSAAVVLTVLLGTSTLLAPAIAQENEDRTDSAQYTESRADYWAAREAWAAKKAAQQAARDGGGGEPEEGEIPTLTAPAATPHTTAPPAAHLYPTDAQLHALRVCESGDDYFINTGNGYYGAYQFSPITWWWIGYSGYPHQAAPWVQDEAARYLYSLMGWTPWPACSRYLGFL
jgi:hypothetical protein